MEYQNVLTKITDLQKKVEELRPLGKQLIAELRNYYKIGLTWSSNALEGNSLTETETKVAIEDNVKSVCELLSALVEIGTFTPLPNEIKKLRQQLDKKQITYGQVDNLLIVIAKKYDAFNNDDAEPETAQQEIDTNIAPKIVLSETFID
jgi:hypothetical protein